LLNALSCCPSAPAAPNQTAPQTATRLNIYGPTDPGRAEVEAFIQAVYAQRFGAVLTQFAPTLVGLCDDKHGLVAAAGYRVASAGPLFLERYLSAPVEQLLLDPSGQPPHRETIVEVGHLAAARSGEGRRLILQMGPHLATQGFDWVVSTLTSELRHLFLRIGVTPLALGVADPSKLGETAQHWGSYYDHHPVVLAGHLGQALQQLARRQQGVNA
jgi:Thermostable hemolysin